MCTEADFTKPTIAAKSIIAYKAVRTYQDSLTSFFSPLQRVGQYGWSNFGRSRTYVVGKTHSATMRSTPGFYCYETLIDARSFACHHWTQKETLRVRIPAGTKIVRGRDKDDRPTINCERLFVVGIV